MIALALACVLAEGELLAIESQPPDAPASWVAASVAREADGRYVRVFVSAPPRGPIEGHLSSVPTWRRCRVRVGGDTTLLHARLAGVAASRRGGRRVLELTFDLADGVVIHGGVPARIRSFGRRDQVL